MKRITNYILLLLILIFGTSCHSRKDYLADLSIPDIKVKIARFDSAVIMIDTTDINHSISDLYKQYPIFMPIYVSNILGFDITDTASLANGLTAYLNDTVYGFASTNKYEKEVFADISDIENQLSVAFGRLKVLYPTMTMPQLYMFVSGFVTPIYISDSCIAIGADMYLGSDYIYYNGVVNEYEKIKMNPEFVAGDVLCAYLYKNIPYNFTTNRLLDQMIYNGKILFVLSQLLPDTPEEYIICYSPEQIKWCKKYEGDIWRCIMDKRDLFKTDNMIITSYMREGPFTAEISQDSPGRLGMWIGWRIINSYMEHNPNITITQLLEQSDAQSILENSQYHP